MTALRIGATALALLIAPALLGCAGVKGRYVWIHDYAAQGPPVGSVINPGDLIQVRVFNQEAMSAKARVRSDGKVSLPFLNDVTAAGYPPVVLAEQLQTRLKAYVKTAVVTVSVEEAAPLRVSVVGEVMKPGLFTLDSGAGLFEALAQAGGFTEFAHRDRIFVVRNGEPVVRIRFSWDMLTSADPAAAAFALRPSDALVVE